MPLTSNQPHRAPSRIEKVREGNRELHLSGNNGRLPLSHADTPECLMEKLIIVSLGWTSERPGTTHHHRGPWNCTWRPHSQLWLGSVVSQSHAQWDHGIFESPDVSILCRTVKLCKTGWHQMDENGGLKCTRILKVVQRAVILERVMDFKRRSHVLRLRNNAAPSPGFTIGWHKGAEQCCSA